MYLFYLDDVELPVTPSALKIKINNKNETVTLINEGDINILKSAGLTDINFKFMIPQVSYPFANNPQSADFYLEKLESLKSGKKPFRFIVTRSKPTQKLFDTNMEVSLEDYTIEEDAKEGFDLMVSVILKQYRNYGTKTVKIKESVGSAAKKPVVKEEPKRQPSKNVKPYIGCSCTVNGTIFETSYGEGRTGTLTNFKGKINLINTKGTHHYHITNMSGGWKGWVIPSAVSNVT